jgi:hypothetical protein
VLGIGLFHGSLHEVIMVRIILMAVMLVLVAVPFLRNHFLRNHGKGSPVEAV